MGSSRLIIHVSELPRMPTIILPFLNPLQAYQPTPTPKAKQSVARKMVRKDILSAAFVDGPPLCYDSRLHRITGNVIGGTCSTDTSLQREHVHHRARIGVFQHRRLGGGLPFRAGRDSDI